MPTLPAAGNRGMTFLRVLALVSALAFLALAAGCTSRPREASAEEEQSLYAEDEKDEGSRAELQVAVPAMAKASALPRTRGRAASAPTSAGEYAPAAPPAPDYASGTGGVVSSPQPSWGAARPRPAARRMVHYSGWTTVRSTEPEKALDTAVAVVAAAGGYLESRSPGFAALRVPAERFDSLFARLMRLGEVVDYGQEAEDITEAFQDAELRLRLVTATLERLEALVGRARTEAQKLRLLRELKRLREEREVIEARRRDLVQRARFASIRLWAQGHAPALAGEAWSRDMADFRWIHSLSPFDDRRFRGRATLKFPAPAGLLVSRKRRPWRATGSRGTEFWGSVLEVEPRGDGRFWAEAIRVRLKDGFKEAEVREVGAFRFCRFQSYGPKPYAYWVGVRARGGKLDLAEFYFPDLAQQDEHLPALMAAVEGKEK